MHHSEASRILGQDIRTRPFSRYRVFYRTDKPIPEILAVLHTARDLGTILASRIQ